VSFPETGPLNVKFGVGIVMRIGVALRELRELASAKGFEVRTSQIRAGFFALYDKDTRAFAKTGTGQRHFSEEHAHAFLFRLPERPGMR
jgi:hypothetical protein